MREHPTEDMAKLLGDQAEDQQTKLELFKDFDRQMQRAFKGIVPRNQRHKLLQQAVANAGDLS